MTYQELAQQALDVQDARNMSGLVHSLFRATNVLWNEARRRGKGTQWINEHPIVTLFLDKLASLNGSRGNSEQVYIAYDKVREIAAGCELAEVEVR